MEIDIREAEDSEFTTIRFATSSSAYCIADTLVKGAQFVTIEDSDNEEGVCIENKLAALNLIKAIEKAIELNWFD
jgi:hypothetical protein